MEEHLKQYSEYQTSDFLSDENFIFWVKNPQSEAADFWEEVLVAFPEKEEIAGSAREIIIALSSQVTTTGEQSKALIWNNIVLSGKVKQRSPVIRILYRSRQIAASLLIIVLSGVVGYYAYLNTNKVVKNGFENTMVVRMPDESVITLNRNSSLTYSRLWNAARSREVQLTGEADFTIKHVAIPGSVTAADSFRVNVNGLRTTVLGTQFNIRSRRGKTFISLAKGKIRIDFMDAMRPPVYLKPGEEFIYDPANAVSAKSKADITARFAWKNESLVLDGTPVSDIITLLEDDYGYKVELKDPALLKRKISGTVPMQKIEDLFFAMSRILNVNIEQNDKTLIISPN